MSNGRPWTNVDTVRLRRLVAAGMTDDQIGETMDRHRDTVRAKRRELGMEPGQSASLTAMMARIKARLRMARA